MPFSDQGPQIRSAVWHEVWTLLKTTVTHNTLWHPLRLKAIGDVEQQDRVINEMLRNLLQSQYVVLRSRWARDEHIEVLQFALN